MASKSPAKLPQNLKYLQPFVAKLAKLPPDDLNEDVDPTPLMRLLQKRIKGLDARAASRALEADYVALEKWLADKPTHPAYWILGVLFSPNLMDGLDPQGVPGAETGEREAPLEKMPEIHFDAPAGWLKTPFPYRVDLECGNLRGTITYVYPLSFDGRVREMKNRHKPVSIAHLSPDDPLERSIIEQKKRMQIISTEFDFAQGEITGKKWVVSETAESGKRVDYLLTVPGGHVSILLEAGGAPFDEAEFERQLGSVRVLL